MTKATYALLATAVILVAGCGGPPNPQQSAAQSVAALRAAEQVGSAVRNFNPCNRGDRNRSSTDYSASSVSDNYGTSIAAGVYKDGEC